MRANPLPVTEEFKANLAAKLTESGQTIAWLEQQLRVPRGTVRHLLDKHRTSVHVEAINNLLGIK